MAYFITTRLQNTLSVIILYMQQIFKTLFDKPDKVEVGDVVNTFLFKVRSILFILNQSLISYYQKN